ncbi:MAG: hypothetical protein IJU35_03525 [Paludibacteraceae bacterium]|nr:hypothetical protein [Paludibacteraceae bacterium]
MFVDSVLASDNASATTCFCVLAGHPLVDKMGLTEGGLLENMAQTSVFIGVDDISHAAPKHGMVAAVLTMEIMRRPAQGEEVLTTATVVEQAMGIKKIEASVSVSGEIIASATFKVV